MSGPEPTPGVTTTAEITGLVTLFASMLHTSTVQIIARIDAASASEAVLWAKHEVELERNTKRAIDRFVKIEEALDAHLQVANVHFAKAHDDDLVMDARVQPVRASLAYVVTHWKTAALVILSVLGLMGVWLDFIRDARIF